MKSRIRVLIVEDEVLTANSLRMDLEDMGIEALPPVARGEDAVRVALSENPSLVLMDVRLAGGMDGIEAARRIRDKSAIPIVFMTGFAPGQIRLPSSISQPAGFLEKPIDAAAVAELINTLSGGNSPHDPESGPGDPESRRRRGDGGLN
jgi:CheY-like chemotaxis protein